MSASECVWLCIALLILSASAEGEPGSGIKVVASEGSDIILPCSLSTKENIEQKLFDWKKVGPNKQEVFMYDAGTHYNNGRPGQDKNFNRRVSHFPLELQFGNASIVIRNTKMNDSGDYMCVFPRLQPEQTFNIQLVWRDSDGNILPAEEPQVSHTGERYDITLLTTVTRTNSNVFHCVATQEELSHRTEDKLYVPYCATAPKPDITVLGGTESGVKLKCHVGHVYPEPKLQWKDSDGNVLPAENPQVSEREGHYNVTLWTTVTPTKTNCFHCVVKQEGSYQVIDQKIILSENLFKRTSEQVITGWMVGWVIGFLSFASLQLVLIVAKCITIRFNRASGCFGSKNSPSEDPSATGSATSTGKLNTLNNGSVV
ncbi:selection and upkeep of intraepithelial T-cells protein 3-like [Neolamprologus brichardi]|uniref:selection and upkeep of intraepithelial T-cells protein 3-like n=1 Tax=Neolamprologus brichardi TaxID=32507 RepID=UPI001643DE8C|nr:selection and upkeep of intraepithelial T-cells protein 3-like [Neolamprologus brichardi]